MNDETRELLSAYLDGAMGESSRRELETRLASSEDMRRELEELRAVSKAVKGLPHEPLPPGFMARFAARRARGEAPKTEWVILPPSLRPVALALSCGVIALAIWDKVAVEPPEAPQTAENAAQVVDGANAPAAQYNFTGRVSGGAAPAAAPQELAAAAAASKSAKSFGGLAGVRGAASGAPYDSSGAASGEAVLTDRSRTQMTEEERSARNESLIGGLEQQKKKMGIARVLRRDDEAAALAGAGAFGGARAAPATAVIMAPTPTLLKKAAPEGPAAADAVLEAKSAGPGRESPDAGLVFSDASSLASSWVILGLPGDPPKTDFSKGRLVLLKPAGTKIVSATAGADAVTVVYRALMPDEASDPARDRVAAIPAEPKTVVIPDASPR